MRYIIVLLPLLLLAGCPSEKTVKMNNSVQQITLQCQDRVMQAYEKRPQKPVVMFKDERNALLYHVVERFTESQTNNISQAMGYCDDLAIAIVQGDAQKFNSIMTAIKTLGGATIGVIGIDVFGKRFGPSAYPQGGDSWNVSGSRVVNKSSNSSSSGDGLGIGNVFGGRTAQGGLEPRQFQTPDSTSLETNSGSLSGTNAPAAVGEGGGNAPVTLPVEE